MGIGAKESRCREDRLRPEHRLARPPHVPERAHVVAGSAANHAGFQVKHDRIGEEDAEECEEENREQVSSRRTMHELEASHRDGANTSSTVMRTMGPEPAVRIVGSID